MKLEMNKEQAYISMNLTHILKYISPIWILFKFYMALVCYWPLCPCDQIFVSLD